jgi:hypothetical protein
MRYTLDLTSNNITYKNGDTLLISFADPFLYVNSIDNISFEFSNLETLQENHDIDFRWTYDIAQLDRATGKPYVVWSAWESYSKNLEVNTNFSSIVTNVLKKQSSIDIQFRIKRIGTDNKAITIKQVFLDITHHDPPKSNSKTPFPVNSSCSGNSCVTPNFSSGISLKCDDGTLFRPYDVMGPGVQLWKDLSFAASEMFGHCVRYFKTQAKLESADPVLREYSLYEVTDVKDIKIMIPDNQIPDNYLSFTPFDMDFTDGLEIHIVREHFERAFGYDDLPEQKDYLYFPLMDRVYEIHSAYLFKDFMMAESYYKVMLFKWQDKANVMRENPEIAQYVDDLVENFDEVLQPEIEKEFIDVTKPQQYSTTSIGGYDKVRSLINNDLIIESRDFSNYYTIVSKYYYDLSRILKWGDLAIKYKLGIDRKSTENTAFTMWLNVKKKTFIKSPNTYDFLLEGYDDSTKKGYRFTINYKESNAKTESITIKINEQAHTISIPELSIDKWYGVIINHMNEFSQLTLHIWETKYNPNQPTQNKTTDLRLVHTTKVDITPEDVYNSGNLELRAGTIQLTNIRVMSESIEEEKQPLFLNQYIVKEARYGLLIDNCIPPIRLIREYVR